MVSGNENVVSVFVEDSNTADQLSGVRARNQQIAGQETTLQHRLRWWNWL